MKIVRKSICITVVENFKLNEQLSFSAEIQAFIGTSDGVRYIDTDVTEHKDIVFMGMKVENNYNTIKSFKQKFMEMGIDVNKQMDGMTDEFIASNLTVDKFESYYNFLDKE